LTLDAGEKCGDFERPMHLFLCTKQWPSSQSVVTAKKVRRGISCDAALTRGAPPLQLAGSKEQLESLQHGLQRLDHYLLNVTNEQRYLYARTVRHLHTAKSTLTRTFWYYTAIYGAICMASFSQLVGVRVMFQRVSHH